MTRSSLASKRAIVLLLLVAGSAIAVAQPSPPDIDDPWGPPARGSQGSGTVTPPNTGSQGPGSPGTGSQAPGTGSPGTGSQAPAPTPGTGSPGPGAGDPGAGSQGPGSAGTGSQGPGAGDPGTGSQGPGSAGTGSPGPGAGTGSQGSAGPGSAGSGSGGPRIIQVPTDLSAPTVSAGASPTVVRLGNKFTVFITATFGAGVEVNLREPLDLGSAFEVTRRLSEDKPTGDGRTQREWQLEVIAWELGDLVMPGIAVTYTTMGKASQVATNQVKLRVEGVLGDVVDDPKAMRADAPPTDLLARDWFWLYVAIGGAAGLTILIGLVAILRGRKRSVFLVGGAIAVPRKFDSASDRALHKLMEIEESGILDRDDDRKKGYAQMVEVIREYIGSRYVATQGGDLTTSELVKKLAKLASSEERTLIEGWLQRCDIVKYGGFKATTADAKRTLEGARSLVVSTTQMPAKVAPAVVAEAAPESPPMQASEPNSPRPTSEPYSPEPSSEPHVPYSPKPSSEPHVPYSPRPTSDSQGSDLPRPSPDSQASYLPQPRSDSQASYSPKPSSEPHVPYSPKPTSDSQTYSPRPSSDSQASYSPKPTSEPPTSSSSANQPSASSTEPASSPSDSPWAPPSRPSSPDDDAATKPFNKEDSA